MKFVTYFIFFFMMLLPISHSGKDKKIEDYDNYQKCVADYNALTRDYNALLEQYHKAAGIKVSGSKKPAESKVKHKLKVLRNKKRKKNKKKK
ncbi:MAG: hypothetical protein ISR65_03605 [Bacteriovoracaceae bacterium]|nr:hypothetical protein [Bacteriovoracaceae bacterium]